VAKISFDKKKTGSARLHVKLNKPGVLSLSLSLSLSLLLSGAVRVVMEETVATHFESVTGFEVRKMQSQRPFAKTGSGLTRTYQDQQERLSVRQVLWESEELLWYSQRDDWGNLYLYLLRRILV
jgi:hypothetical protein